MTGDQYTRFSEIQDLESMFAKVWTKGFSSHRKVLEMENPRVLKNIKAGWYISKSETVILYIHKASNPDPMVTLYSKLRGGKLLKYFLSGESALESTTRAISEQEARRYIAVWRLTA